MFTKRTIADLDAYMATVVNEALAGIRSKREREAILQAASKLTRQLSKSILQRQLLTALQQGAAPKTLADLQQFVGARASRWLKPVRIAGGLPATPLQLTGRPADPMLTPGEVARELGVSAKTVTNWCRQGLLRCEVLESGHRRIPSSALEAYRADRGRWQRADGIVQAASGAMPDLDEAAIFDEIAGRRRG